MRRNPAKAIPSATSGFGISRLDPALALAGVRAAAPDVDAFLDEKMAEHGLDESKTVPGRLLPGHDDGAACRPAPPKPLAGIIGFSGMLAGPEMLKGEIKSRPPVLLVTATRTRCCRMG